MYEEAKKDSEKHYLDLDQFGATLTIAIKNDSEVYTRLSGLVSTKHLVQDESVIHYKAKVSVLNEARHGTSKAGNEYNMVTNRLAMPVLKEVELITED